MFSLVTKIKQYAYLFRLNKPFLAIPFAATTAFIVTDGLPDARKFTGLMLAMFGGFMAGNAFNAITDFELDKNNPRTADRPLASGALSLTEVFFALFFSICIVIIGTAIINWRYIFLLPIPLMFCFGYSLSKRYTWLCHLFLGITNAICPVASWGIFAGWRDLRWILMGAIVCFWTIGFELIYSAQDIEYDKEAKMNSIPSRFGLKITYRLSVVCHIIMYILLAILLYLLPMNVMLYITLGIGVATPFLVWEHLLVKNNQITNPELAFNLNQVYSLIILGFAILQKILGR